MAFVTFSEIVNIIDSVEHREGGLTVFFKCARTGRVLEARGSYPDSKRRRFLQVSTGSTVRALLAQLSAIIRRYTGIYIPLGNAFQTHDVPGGGSGFTNDADRQAAAVAAFQTVAEYPGKPVRRGRFNFIDNQWTLVD